MPKNREYILRLTSEEKTKLVRTAKERGLSVAQMIREDYELSGAFDLRVLLNASEGDKTDA